MIQFACLVVLWMIKSYFYTSILFPLMLVVMIGIRKSLDCLFTRRELKILDDVMPEIYKRAVVEDEHSLGEGEVSKLFFVRFSSPADDLNILIFSSIENGFEYHDAYLSMTLNKKHTQLLWHWKSYIVCFFLW